MSDQDPINEVANPTDAARADNAVTDAELEDEIRALAQLLFDIHLAKREKRRN